MSFTNYIFMCLKDIHLIDFSLRTGITFCLETGGDECRHKRTEL